MWTKHEKYDDMVQAAWHECQGAGHDLPGLWERLRGVSTHMRRWSYEVFGSVQQQIKKLRTLLDEARNRSCTSKDLGKSG
jgi:hypothetical protein